MVRMSHDRAAHLIRRSFWPPAWRTECPGPAGTGNAWGYSRADARVTFNKGYGSGSIADAIARATGAMTTAVTIGPGAPLGLRAHYGDRDQYRDTFGRGFVSGYDDGYYGRNARDYSYSNDRYRNDDRYGPLPRHTPLFIRLRRLRQRLPERTLLRRQLQRKLHVQPLGTIADIARAWRRAATTGSTTDARLQSTASEVVSRSWLQGRLARGVLYETRFAMVSCAAYDQGAIANGIATRREDFRIRLTKLEADS